MQMTKGREITVTRASHIYDLFLVYRFSVLDRSVNKLFFSFLLTFVLYDHCYV